MGRLRTFSQHHGHLRVDGDRHPKSRPLSSALRGMKALLGLVELNVHLPLRITGTAAPGRRALRRSPEVTGGRGGQEASSCEQPVDGARAGDSAPFAAMSRWKAAHEQGRPSQPTPFSRNSSFLSGSYNSTRAGSLRDLDRSPPRGCRHLSSVRSLRWVYDRLVKRYIMCP